MKLTRLAISLLVLTLLGVAQWGVIDDIGRRYTEDGIKRALITFGVARGLNGVISVAQGTEVAVEPAGIGLTFTPGQILDPVNDLIERFSWVVLASGTSLGIQRVLLDLTSWAGFTVLAGVAVLAAVVVLWWPRPLSARRRRIFYRLAAVLLILRFSIPLIAICSEGLYSHFLEPQYTASQQQLERTAQVLSDINKESRPPAPGAEDLSFLENARRAYESAASAMNIDERIEEFKQSAANVSENAINLIVVFVLQTILFPLIFLWIVIKLVKRAVGARFGL